MSETVRSVMLIDCATAAFSLPGESESGDRHVALPTPRGALVAVVDGLGHGGEAAEAAKIAIGTLESHADESLVSLVRRCHDKLKSTRGAVMSLASLNEHNHTLTWLSVGNVEGVLLRADPTAVPATENILMRAGVVGFRLPRLQAVVMDIFPSDVLIFATDGIRTSFAKDVRPADSPQQMADLICSKYSKGNDDALVLVARYLGRSS